MNTEEPNTATTVRNPYSKTSPNLLLAPDLTAPLVQPPMLDTTNDHLLLQLNSSVKTDHESNIEFIPTSNNLPIVDRLLSRNLSFTSAEIVTVRELNTALTCSFPSVVTGKSVRFVGSIAFVDTVNMWVLLSDPSPSQPTSAITNPYQKARVSVSDGIRFSLDNKSDLNSDRLSIEGLPRKRKLVSMTNPRNSSILSKRFSIDPQDSHLQIIEENQRRSIAMIVVDITLVPSLFNCAVGDQLMVIGEVREISNPTSSSNLSDTLKVLYRITSCKQHDNSLHVDEHDQQQTMVESNKYQYSIIKARIIRNYSGVDMNLFEEALKLRRNYLKDQGAQYGTGLLSE